MAKVFVVGVGMTKFVKPNTGGDYPEFAKEATIDAIKDGDGDEAGIVYEDIQQAVCAYVSGDSTCGQRVLYQIGMTGIPIYNVHNYGATGSSALFLGKQLIEGEIADVMLVLGFEKMQPGSLKSNFSDRTHPFDRQAEKFLSMTKMLPGPTTPQYFGNAGLEHMRKYGTTQLHVAKVAAKNYRHGANNPRAQTNKAYNVDDVLNSKKIFGPLTKLACCPTTDGASAAILMSEKAVIRFGLQHKAVEILGMEMSTDSPSIFRENSFIKLVGYDMTVNASRRLYEKTNISPKDIDVAEIHDCFATNEMITYEGLGFCNVGEAGKFIDAGDNTYGGQVVVNPSGGLIAKGNPLGATGLAQCAELV